MKNFLKYKPTVLLFLIITIIFGIIVDFQRGSYGNMILDVLSALLWGFIYFYNLGEIVLRQRFLKVVLIIIFVSNIDHFLYTHYFVFALIVFTFLFLVLSNELTKKE